MSIEAMKRIKSLLQDGDKIDSHTISAVVAECDAVILTQQPDNTECKSVQKRLAAQQPATPEPVAWIRRHPNGALSNELLIHVQVEQVRRDSGAWVPLYTHPAPGVPEFSRIAKRKLDELQEQGFAITGYAIQRGPVRGFIDCSGFVGWWQGEPDPGVPEQDWERKERLQSIADTAAASGLFGLAQKWANNEIHSYQFTHQAAAIVLKAMLAASPAQKGGE